MCVKVVDDCTTQRGGGGEREQVAEEVPQVSVMKQPHVCV